MSKCLIVLPAFLVFLSAVAAPAAAQLPCSCGIPHPFMTPPTTCECVGGNVVATMVFNMPIATTVVTRGAFPGLSAPNCPGSGHNGLRLAVAPAPLGAGIAPIAAVALDANTVQLTYPGAQFFGCDPGTVSP